MILKIENLSLKFNKKIIFQNFNLELKPGQLLIVNGDNGRGKTSFLKLLSGLIPFDSGSILCVEYDIKENFDDYFYDYTYIPSEDILDESFTIKYYLNFWAKISDNEILINSAINYFKLESLLDHKISQLSSGWRKRILLAKLLIDNRLIWFLDEPFNFLDNNGQDLLINMINARLLSQGLVVLTSNKVIDQFKDASFLDLNKNEN